MHLNIPATRYISVDYPAVVQNDDKMLHTLGGEDVVTKTYNDTSKRLELKFRPDDVYCKAACADQHSTTCLLLKVKRKRGTSRVGECNDETTGASAGEPSVVKPSEIEGEILGVVDAEYRFNTLCDFQYLSMAKDGDEYRNLEPELMINSLQSSSWFHEPAQLHLPPSIFSRYDHPGSYCFKDPPQQRGGAGRELAAQIDPKFIGLGRQKRHNYTRVFSHMDQLVPIDPHPEVIERLSNRLARTDIVERIKEKFNEQPIWSRNALHAQCPGVSEDDLKYIFPAIAYYCLTGPFRGMWVKMGYDTRKEPGSKIYQCLDFRFPRVKNMIKAKRAALSYKLPTTVSKFHSQAATIKYELLENPDASASNSDGSKNTSQESLEARYIFKPGQIPAYRQMFYQLCHIEEPQVQQLIHSNDGIETCCTEQDGWCLPETIEKCRKILSGHVLKLLGIGASDASTPGKGRRGRAQAASATAAACATDVTAAADLTAAAAAVSSIAEESRSSSSTPAVTAAAVFSNRKNDDDDEDIEQGDDTDEYDNYDDN